MNTELEARALPSEGWRAHVGGMGDTATPPISAELWARLRRFDAVCYLSFHRDDQWLEAGAGGKMYWCGLNNPKAEHRRVWRIRMSPRGSEAYHDILDADGKTFADAVLAAVEEAERRGWHRRLGAWR